MRKPKQVSILPDISFEKTKLNMFDRKKGIVTLTFYRT